MYGSKRGSYAGIKVAFGHTIVELPIIIILSFGFFHLSTISVASSEILKSIGLLGGATIIFFSILQIRSILRTIKNNVEVSNAFEDKVRYAFNNKPILGGILFSLLNPFFLVWWLTVGLKIISDSISIFGLLVGSLAVFIFHIWMDYAWLGGTSLLAFKGISILKARFYNIFLFGLSILLMSYGVYWILVNLYQQ